MRQSLIFISVFLLCLTQVYSVSVTIHFYSDSQCKQLTNTLSYDMGTCSSTGTCNQQCYGWSHQTFQGTMHNSATNFKCYKDWGITYTQHITTLGCDSLNPSSKVTMIGCCEQEPSGQLWAEIIPSDASDLSSCAAPSGSLPENTCYTASSNTIASYSSSSSPIVDAVSSKYGSILLLTIMTILAFILLIR